MNNKVIKMVSYREREVQKWKHFEDTYLVYLKDITI